MVKHHVQKRYFALLSRFLCPTVFLNENIKNRLPSFLSESAFGYFCILCEYVDTLEHICNRHIAQINEKVLACNKNPLARIENLLASKCSERDQDVTLTAKPYTTLDHLCLRNTVPSASFHTYCTMKPTTTSLQVSGCALV